MRLRCRAGRARGVPGDSGRGQSVRPNPREPPLVCPVRIQQITTVVTRTALHIRAGLTALAACQSKVACMPCGPGISIRGRGRSPVRTPKVPLRNWLIPCKPHRHAFFALNVIPKRHRTRVAHTVFEKTGFDIFNLFADDPERCVRTAAELPRFHLGEGLTAASRNPWGNAVLRQGNAQRRFQASLSGQISTSGRRSGFQTLGLRRLQVPPANSGPPQRKLSRNGGHDPRLRSAARKEPSALVWSSGISINCGRRG